MLITPADIHDVTGYTQPSAQMRWLRRHGWKFTVNALGHPRVALAEFNRHMVGGRAIKQEPNFEALNG